MNTHTVTLADRDGVEARQIAFFAAFLLPIYKLVETPSLLAGFLQGDLLLPALLHFLLDAGIIAVVLYCASRSQKTLLQRLIETLGGWVKVVYWALCIFFLLAAVLPLLDLEKFVYSVFYDTAPTLFSFAFFFIFAAFLATKGLKALGRLGDLCLFLFALPFFALIAMSLVEADFTNLLPFFEKRFGDTMYAMNYTKAHFTDAIFLLPLLLNLRYKKGDGLKIGAGYAGGALMTLLFLAVFYGLFSSIAPREHYAFAKIAQYFPVLSVIGRIDLLFVFVLCIPLFFYVATPLHYATHFLSSAFEVKGKTLISAGVCLAALVFTLFFNRRYDGIYALFGNTLSFVFYLFDFAPLALLFLPKKSKKEAVYA